MKKFLDNFVSLGIVLAFLFPIIAGALVSYPPGSLLQPGDVTSSIIRDGAILNVDVNAAAAILTSKLEGGNGDGTIPYSDYGHLSTSTNLTYATSTKTLTVAGGVIAATSTCFGTSCQTWPTGDGTAGQFLETDGAGTLSYGTPAATMITQTYTAGEAIATGTPVYIADGTIQTGTTTQYSFVTGSEIDQGIGDASSDQEVAVSFTPSSTFTPSLLAITAFKSGTPTDNFTVSVESDSSGAPSGTALYSGTIAGSSLSTSRDTHYITFSGSGTLNADTTYWLVLGRSGAVSASNYFKTAACFGTPCSLTMHTYNGSTWSSLSRGLNGPLFQVITFQDYGDVYKTSANTTGRYTNYVGISTGTYATSSAAQIAVAGVVTGLSGLATSTNYYISDTLGELSTTAGTNSIKVCHAFTPTTCLMTFIW